MTIQNNHFSTQLQNINRPSAAERTTARGMSTSTAGTTASTASTEDKATQTSVSPALPAGLVGNHVNTTA
jgi:hypothetical protein